MKLEEQLVFFRLTPEGARALKDRVPEGGSFPAHVVAEKGYGVWVVSPEQPADRAARSDEVLLLKWPHIATATLMRPRGPAKPYLTAVPGRKKGR